MGLDARATTPELVRTVCHLAAEVRSFERASVVMKRVFGVEISDTTIGRLVRQVGQELSVQEAGGQEEEGGKEVVVPQMAVVSCDGGRLRTRQPGQGRGVKLSGETGWRETKNALFERMTPQAEHCPGVDPCAQLPSSFRSVKKVAEMVEKTLSEVPEAPDDAEAAERVVYRGPQRVLRSVVCSLGCSEEFGRKMEQEARRRRFFEADRRAFLGDGLAWNWSIWKKHFSSFTPILDFVHALQYVYRAAMALGQEEGSGWSLYEEHISLCWSGRVDEVIAALRGACQRRGVSPEEKLPEDHPLQPVIEAVRYLSNNRQRMDYPAYRKAGLPVTSAPMESLIKQINMRVKGTEMFWDDPAGGEAILHLRAASLCDDDRLNEYLKTRPGYPFVRRSTPLKNAA